VTHAVWTVIRYVLRFLVLWTVDALSLIVTAALVPGVGFSGAGIGLIFLEALAAAFVLGVVNLLIRPLVLLLARPLGWIAVFLIGFVVNALALLITSAILPDFQLTTVLSAFVAGIVFALVNAVFTGVMDVDEEGSFYQNLIERRAKKTSFKGSDEPGRGLVMMEIDGLSFHHMTRALDEGAMPFLKKLMEEEGYRLSRVDCGIPSQTSACQAGIMFGDNHDIPAFRWYDKDEKKLLVSSKDAAEINRRFAHGAGLMRGGSSIDNMMNGDAEKSLLTLADLRTDDKEQSRRRAEDIYLLMLNPYSFMRSVALFFASVVREVWQGWRQRRKDVQPRLNRLHGFYPFVRAATCVLVRDISVNLTIMDIMRGSPSIYVTWPGYDEVAHHSGPWTGDAFGELTRYDRIIRRVHKVIKEKASRHYDLIILSDHGQSFGATFLQRYGLSLKELIEQHLPHGVTVSQSVGGDTGVTTLSAASGELENVHSLGVGGSVGRVASRQGQKLLAKGVERDLHTSGGAAPADAEVMAYGSGNLAQVYFDLYPRKILLSELEEAYPGMVDALAQHEGIGFVCGYEDNGVPVVLGKTGRRNLHTGEVVGDDPLLPFANPGRDTVGAADIEIRVWQVRRVMDFPHAGDLMVNSAVFSDGTVAALEELIGSHGGLGGEQTDAFLLHPGDLEVPPTRNSVDVFAILNARRGLPVVDAEGGSPA
jgi:uncharacterized membrane protein YvlD (DUF360 family)